MKRIPPARRPIALTCSMLCTRAHLTVALAMCSALVSPACSKKSPTGDAPSTASSSAVSRPEAELAQNKAARDTELAQNTATLSQINMNALPRWTATLENQRFLVEGEPRVEESWLWPDYQPLGGAVPCPEAKAIEKRPDNDEFAAKKNKSDAMAAWQKCLDKARAAVGPRPELAVLEVPLRPSPYDFDRHRYVLTSVYLANTAVPSLDFFGGYRSRDSLVFGLGGVEPNACFARSAGPAGDLALVIGRAESPAFGQCDYLCIVLDKNETDAQAIKPRLQQDESTLDNRTNEGAVTAVSALLRLQLAFRPGPYGQTSLTCVRDVWTGDHLSRVESNLKAFVSTGVGYRVIDKEGVLIDWTPVASASM
jgi:hypothetical protein